MSRFRLPSLRFCMSLGAAIAVAGVLLNQRSAPSPGGDGPGVVYVYFPSLCAAPGDSSDCKEIPRAERPAFASMQACSAYADQALRQEHNPRLMASCLKQQEG